MRISARLTGAVVAIAVSLVLVGCGTTQSVVDDSGRELAKPSRVFRYVTVQDYRALVKTKDGKSELAQRAFPDKIAHALRSSGFAKVSRNGEVNPDTLVISGDITRYAEGNAALRFLVGMGAGSSYFDATTWFKDSNGATLGKVVTDKNSWGLGGGLAATQTPDTFMNGAATKIAEEARRFSGAGATDRGANSAGAAPQN